MSDKLIRHYGPKAFDDHRLAPEWSVIAAAARALAS